VPLSPNQLIFVFQIAQIASEADDHVKPVINESIGSVSILIFMSSVSFFECTVVKFLCQVFQFATVLHLC